MTSKVTLKKGLDIKLRGSAQYNEPHEVKPTKCAITADDFRGIIPKVDVKEGDNVAIGTPLFHDKVHPEIIVVSPIAGTIEKVVRGERRKLERIVITPSESNECIKLDTKADNRASAKGLLLASGLWTMLRQRPYDIIPNPDITPRDIFITAFDSAPLAPDLSALLTGHESQLIAGVKLLRHLTDGNIYIGTRHGDGFYDIEGVSIIEFDGPHPSGNAGIQCANIAPVNKGETVWVLDAITLMRIGQLIEIGTPSMSTTLALTGSEVCNPHYITTTIGADIASLTKGNINDNGHKHRIISGNVLTGIPVAMDGYLRYPYRHITVIPEGDDCDEFLGWASLSPSKMSTSRSFPGHFTKRLFSPDARLQGGRRAMILSGEYDKVLPMDILPEYLIKSIMARDIDRMEQLGIYEVAAEDFALCEYVDASKLELQKIVQDGLDYLRNELS